MDKLHLHRHNKVKYAYVEKDCLARLTVANRPGVTRLHWAFSDQSSLCEYDRYFTTRLSDVRSVVDFVLDLVPNGELVTKINEVRATTSGTMILSQGDRDNSWVHCPWNAHGFTPLRSSMRSAGCMISESSIGTYQ
jgi:hypothetical protein